MQNISYPEQYQKTMFLEIDYSTLRSTFSDWAVDVVMSRV